MSKSSVLKRILLAVFGCFLFILIAYGWMKLNEGGPVPYPLNTGSFYSIGSATIDSATLLDDVKNGKEPFLKNIQADLPEDITFVTTIGWSQNDYLEIVEALHREIWKDNPRDWHLYRIVFQTSCENLAGKFEYADFYYFQEVKRDGRIMYEVRNILIEPEYGYIACGGDTFYPRPFIDRWDKIDLEMITKFPAEKALALAEQQGGSNIRMGVENACWIHVSLWPWGYEYNDWMVSYGGNIDLHDNVFWISLD
jgi:hypothetical protein